MSDPSELWGIDDGFACFALVVVGGVVKQAAPIARWSEGKPISEVARYYERRGALVELIRGEVMANNGMIELCAVWLSEIKRSDHAGEKFMAGDLGRNARLLIFKNRNKRNDKDPDYRVFIAPNDQQQGRGRGGNSAPGRSGEVTGRRAGESQPSGRRADPPPQSGDDQEFDFDP